MTAPQQSFQYTVCGLYVPDRYVDGGRPIADPRLWQTYCGGHEAMDAVGAFGFAQNEVRGETNAAGYSPQDLALSSIHVGDVRTLHGFDLADLDFTTEEVDHEAEHADGELTQYTICGLFLSTFQVCSYVYTAPGPKAAYLAAYTEAANEEHETLLLCAIHERDVPSIDLGNFVYADPVIDSAASMAVQRQDWGNLPS